MSKIHFVIMGNVFPSNKDIHCQYDLKGSTIGRMFDKSRIKPGVPVVLKDLNWLEDKCKFQLGPIKRKQFLDQLESDAKFLAENNIMDYSLLTGIHKLERGNRDGLRNATLTIFDPITKHRRETTFPESRRASQVRKWIAQAGPISIEQSEALLETTFKEYYLKLIFSKLNNLFYCEEGGFISTNENNELTDELYCFGIIDIMTPYSFTKKIEHCWKSLRNDKNKISAICPQLYADRFLKFLKDSIKLQNLKEDSN